MIVALSAVPDRTAVPVVPSAAPGLAWRSTSPPAPPTPSSALFQVTVSSGYPLSAVMKELIPERSSETTTFVTVGPLFGGASAQLICGGSPELSGCGTPTLVFCI